MTEDYKALYEEKCREYDDLDEQFQLFQDETNAIINQLEDQLKEVKKKNQNLTRDVVDLKDKRKTQTQQLERELELIKKEKNEFQTKFYEFQKKVVDLENINESLESDIRAERSMLNEYETRVEKTMEELALLQTQLEENKSTNQEQIARLRSQLKQTEQELYVVHLKAQKHHDESEKRSRMSEISMSSRGNETRRQMPEQSQSTVFLKKQPTPSQFSVVNPGTSFYKTVDLMTNLLGDLDVKMNKLKAERRALAIN